MQPASDFSAAKVCAAGPVRAFLPCRKGSERVPKKNVRPFGPYSCGLIEIKLQQLLACSEIDQVVLSTNDQEIIDYAARLEEPRLLVHQRVDSLATSATSTDALVSHACELISSGHILWTHVTSPFLGTELYSAIIAEYRDALSEGYDSLMTTTPIHGFLWNEEGPINYDRRIEKWPRTQTIEPIHEINSALFLAPVDVYHRHNDRIGERPLLYALDRFSGFDIDWEEDFTLAEQLLLGKLVSV